MRTLSPKRGRSRNLSPSRQERTRLLVQRMAIMSGNDEALLDSPKESLYAGLGKTSAMDASKAFKQKAEPYVTLYYGARDPSSILSKSSKATTPTSVATTSTGSMDSSI